MTTKIPLVFEMETGDPDDFLTLLWLADHPRVRLKAVLVTPGGRDQCQLVRWGLDLCGQQDVPIGALHGSSWWETEQADKRRVSEWHYRTFNVDDTLRRYSPGTVHLGPELLRRVWLEGPLTVVCGSAPKNLAATTRQLTDEASGFVAAAVPPLRWIQQGGFAGDNLVAKPLEKFKGRLTCPSYNPGGAPKDTLMLLEHPSIIRRLFVSKNVCHGVIWDARLHQRVSLAAADPGHPPLRQGLMAMLRGFRACTEKGHSKAAHDLVAAAVALDEDVCRFSPEVGIYREHGDWGARPRPGTNAYISVGFHEKRFITAITEKAAA